LAQAPKPGARRNAEDTAAAVKVVWVIVVRGEEYRLRRADLGPADARLVRQTTGLRLLAIMGEIGGVDFDYTTVLWWLARRHAGETDLTYAQAEAEFPSYEEALEGAVTVKLDTIEAQDGEDGSPEA
jgi:hypothetical protein